MFLKRVLETRGTNPSRLARELGAGDGKTAETWERSLRRWIKPSAQRLSERNAADLGEALNADLSVYAETENAAQLLTQILQRLDRAEARLTALEGGEPTP